MIFSSFKVWGNRLIFFSALAICGSHGLLSAQTQPPPPPPKTAPTPTPKQPSELQKALQEFRVQVGGQNNSNGGAIKAASTQNSYTGRIYENFRNNAMDAIPHEVRQRGGTKSLLQRNQFGFNVNGPVRLPFIYDGRGKTFFSVSYEGTIERIAQSNLFTLPTAQQRVGDFSDNADAAGQAVKIYDPLTTRPNPAYDPTKELNENNLQYLRDPFPDNTIPQSRIDPVARALIALYPKPNANVGPFLQNNYFINNPFENRANGMITKVDHAITEKQQLSLHVSISSGTRKSPVYFAGPANSGVPGYDYKTRSVVLADTWTRSPRMSLFFRLTATHNLTASINSAPAGQNYPRQLGLSGLFSEIFPTFRFGNYLGIGPRNKSAFRESSYAVNPYISISLNRKSHILRFAQSVRRNYENIYSPYAPAGYFTFNTQITGLPGIRNTGNTFASFLLGLVNRGEETIVRHPSYYRKNFTNYFFSDEYRLRSRVTLTASLNIESSSPRIEKYNRQSTVSFNHLNPANGKPGALIFAGKNGIGRGLQPGTVRAEPTIGLALNPFNNRKTVVRMSFGQSYQGYPVYGNHFGTQGFNIATVFVSPNDQLEPAFILRNGVPQNFVAPPFLAPTAANGTNADFVDDSGRLPATQQWTMNIQRELPRSFAVEIGYIGWRGRNLFVDSLVRLNAVPVENLKYRDQLYTQSFRDSLRPSPQYQNIETGGVYPAGSARGNALNISLDKRLSGGIYGRVSYRFAKQMDNVSVGAAQDPNNLDVEMTLNPSDVTHSLQASYTCELPFGKGKPWLSNGELLAKFLGGWSLSGLTTWRGGTPLIIRPYFNRTGNLISLLHVNTVPGADPKVNNKTSQNWFNPEAFAQPDDFTPGTASYTHPTLRTPWDQFHHLSMTKRIEMSSDTSLEWVVESFNFPNHANLNDPDTRIGPVSSPNLNAGKIIGSTGGRVMQLGLRILF